MTLLHRDNDDCLGNDTEFPLASAFLCLSATVKLFLRLHFMELCYFLPTHAYISTAALMKS